MTAALALPMIVMVGSGIDFMRHETTRSKVQDSLDRGVLAAASLTQTQNAEGTIRGFLAASGIHGDYDLTVHEESSTNARHVTAEISLTVPTYFLPLIGRDRIGVSAASSAEERRPNIEISLLLDMSGSMWDNKGILQLKPAARDFIDTILKPDVRAVTSVTLVPYAGQVAVDQKMFRFLTGFPSYTRGRAGVDAGTTHCFEFSNTDLRSAAVPAFSALDQSQQFTWYNKGQRPNKEPWWCPSDETAIRFLSNDPAKLKQAINDLKLYDGTGTAIAMKWAAMALNPSASTGLRQAANLGIVDTPFRDRPAAYDDEDTRKFIVLMTDGGIGPQFRPKDSRIDKMEYSVTEMEKTHGKTFWANNTTREQLLALCKAAKDNGIGVFTIGFKLAGQAATARDDMRKCASDESMYHQVEGLDINDAFQAIATDIQRIRLTS